MAKEVGALIKLQIKGGAANPSPPVGPALERRGCDEAWGLEPSPHQALKPSVSEALARQETRVAAFNPSRRIRRRPKRGRD